jgi:hypothetical protein
VTLGIIAATEKRGTSVGAAASHSLYHQRIANRTVRQRLRRVVNRRKALRLALAACRANAADKSALSFQLEPLQRNSNNENQNGADDDYRFDFPKQGLGELLDLRNQHSRIPLNSCDLFKSFLADGSPATASLAASYDYS